MSKHSETCQAITDELIKILESGKPLPWRTLLKKPDRNSGSPASILRSRPVGNAVTKNDYSGINFIILAMAAYRNGFASRWWATYRQWEQIGAKVKKGEKGTAIVFYSRQTVETKEGKEDEEPFWKWYTVFNVEQVEGEHLNRYWAGAQEARLQKIDIEERFKQADEMIA